MRKWICIAAISVMVQSCSTLAMNFPPFTFGRADREYPALAYRKQEPTENIYTRDWQLEHRVRGNEIFDRDWHLEFRIKDNAIYDRGWNLKFRIKR